MPTLNSQGDIHIPDNLMHSMGLKPGMELSVERQGDAIVMRPVKSRTASKVEDGPKILGDSGAAVSLEAMDDASGKGAASTTQSETDWKRENRASIASYNQSVEEYGVFSDGIRTF